MNRAARFLCAMAVLAAAAAAAQNPGAASEPDVLRVAGTIAASQEWRGTVWITDDTTIDGAVVTVMPGTTIEFCGPAQKRCCVLRFGNSAVRQNLHGVMYSIRGALTGMDQVSPPVSRLRRETPSP